MHDGSIQQEQLVFSQLVTQAPPLTVAEGHETVRFENSGSVVGQKPFWPKLFWLGKGLGVLVDSADQGDNVGVLGDFIAFKLQSPAME